MRLNFDGSKVCSRAAVIDCTVATTTRAEGRARIGPCSRYTSTPSIPGSSSHICETRLSRSFSQRHEPPFASVAAMTWLAVNVFPVPVAITARVDRSPWRYCAMAVSIAARW